MSDQSTLRLLLARDELAQSVTDTVHRTRPELTVQRLDIVPANRGFPAFVNDLSIDISEVAIVTLLQAVAAGKPVGLLPVTVLGRFQHQTLISCRGLGLDALPGSSVGVRSWTQTTGVWVRGALVEQFGIDLRGIDWVTYEGSHLLGTPDPAWVRRAPEGATPERDLAEGRLDFAITGTEVPGATPAIGDPQAAAKAWARAAGCVPVNHVVGVSLALARRYPDMTLAVYGALKEAAGLPPSDGLDLTPAGWNALRGTFAKASAYAFAQEILPREVSLDELVRSTEEALAGASGAGGDLLS